MNQEVPQPTTATRWPAAGSVPARPAARLAPSRQVSGWLAISCAMYSVRLTCTPLAQSRSARLPGERRGQQVLVRIEQLVAHGDGLRRGQRGGGVRVQQRGLVDVGARFLQGRPGRQLTDVEERPAQPRT